MTLLPILYWIVLILSCIGLFVPYNPQNPSVWSRISGVAEIVLFIIIGLHSFKVPL